VEGAVVEQDGTPVYQAGPEYLDKEIMVEQAQHLLQIQVVVVAAVLHKLVQILFLELVE
jgi:hypothetical protein